MNTFIYCDYSNLHVTAKYYSAVVKGRASSIRDANDMGVQSEWICNFHNLGATAKRALLVTSGRFLEKREAQRAGWEIKVLPRSKRSGEKCVDTTIAVEMMSDAYNYINPDRDHMILIAGDLDHLPAVSHLVGAGVDVTVMFWPSCAYELQAAATRYVNLAHYYDQITIPWKPQYKRVGNRTMIERRQIST